MSFRRTLQRAAMIVAASALALCNVAIGQQLPDPNADVSISHPAFAKGKGPRVAIDGGHHNFHTADGLFAPFAAVLRNDGFKVSASSASLAPDTLANVDVLVIANALNEDNVDRWALPTPSAFTPAEIAAVAEWVRNGGSVLLIADHLPFAGAAADMAEAFGFSFVNGFALTKQQNAGPDSFSIRDGTLKQDVVTLGSRPEESIDSVATFTGAAFRAPAAARPLLTLSDGFVLATPQVAWEFSDATPTFSGDGWLQGAVMPFGKGRVGVFGEAAMFTAQVVADRPGVRIGFNAAEAPGNKQFVLNVMHWLAGVLPP